MPPQSTRQYEPVTARIVGFERPPKVISLAQTNMPRWSRPTAHLSPADLHIVTFGERAETAMQIILEKDDVAPASIISLGLNETIADIRRVIADIVAAASATSRLVITGPEHLLMTSVAEARRRGLNEDEIVVHTVDDGTQLGEVAELNTETNNRQIFCPCCRTIFASITAVGDAIDCPNCSTKLAVYYHYSPFTGAYLARPTGEESGT